MGVEARHKPNCRKASQKEADCTCKAARYRGVYYVAGKVIARSEWFPSKAQATSWMATAQSTRPVKGAQRTVSEVAPDVWARLREGSVLNRENEPYKAGVIDTYAQLFKNHLEPQIGHKLVSDVRPVHVRQVVAHLRTYLAASTVRTTMIPLQVIFRTAMLDELCRENPCMKLGLTSRRVSEVEVVDRDQALAMLEGLDPEIRLGWAFAFFAGLRRGEIAALTYGRISDTSIAVNRSWHVNRREYTSPKHGKNRVAPLPRLLARMIEEHRPAGASEDDLIFPAPDREGPRSADGFRKMAHTVWKKNGQPLLTLHEGRHSFASMMIGSGTLKNPKELSDVLGHSSVAFTLDIYGHLFPNAHEGIVSAMNDYLDAA